MSDKWPEWIEIKDKRYEAKLTPRRIGLRIIRTSTPVGRSSIMIKRPKPVGDTAWYDTPVSLEKIPESSGVGVVLLGNYYARILPRTLWLTHPRDTTSIGEMSDGIRQRLEQCAELSRIQSSRRRYHALCKDAMLSKDVMLHIASKELLKAARSLTVCHAGSPGLDLARSNVIRQAHLYAETHDKAPEEFLDDEDRRRLETVAPRVAAWRKSLDRGHGIDPPVPISSEGKQS